MNHFIVKCLTRLRLIHGGPIEVLVYDRHEGDITVEFACYKCDCQMDLTDVDVYPDLNSVVYGMTPFEVYPLRCCDEKSTWHWDGRVLWWDVDLEQTC